MNLQVWGFFVCGGVVFFFFVQCQQQGQGLDIAAFNKNQLGTKTQIQKKWSTKGPVNSWRLRFGSLNISSYCHERCQRAFQTFTGSWQVCCKTCERFWYVGVVTGGCQGCACLSWVAVGVLALPEQQHFQFHARQQYFLKSSQELSNRAATSIAFTWHEKAESLESKPKQEHAKISNSNT